MFYALMTTGSISTFLKCTYINGIQCVKVLLLSQSNATSIIVTIIFSYPLTICFYYLVDITPKTCVGQRSFVTFSRCGTTLPVTGNPVCLHLNVITQQIEIFLFLPTKCPTVFTRLLLTLMAVGMWCPMDSVRGFL